MPPEVNDISKYAIFRGLTVDIDFTPFILTYNPNTEYLIRVTEYNGEVKRRWGFKLPLELSLDSVKEAIDDFFNAGEQHFSVTVIACKDDENVLRSICGALGA